jgi:hypothetical protein
MGEVLVSVDVGEDKYLLDAECDLGDLNVSDIVTWG